MSKTLNGVFKELMCNNFPKITKLFAPETHNAFEKKTKLRNVCLALVEQVGIENIGDYLEFGVYQGTSLNYMFHTFMELKLNHIRLFGFDSFQGLPAIAAIDNENDLQPGEHASSMDWTSNFLTENGIDWNRTFLIKGWYADTLTKTLIVDYKIEKASIILIDCDLYSSAKEGLKFCKALIKDTSIIFFNDWNPEGLKGAKRAFQEFLKENPYFKAELMDTFNYNTYKLIGNIFLVTNTIKLGT